MSEIPAFSSVHLRFLDWPEVLDRLAGFAQSDSGRRACLTLPFLPTSGAANARARHIDGLAQLNRDHQRWPALAFPPIADLLDAASRGAVLGAPELKTLGAFCDVTAGVRRFFLEYDPPDAPGTDPQADTSRDENPHMLARALGTYPNLAQRARETFDATGELRDSASPELGRLRRERDQLAGHAREQVDRLLHSEAFAPYLQDEFVTLRADRFVLPVKASFKATGLGIVHDTSRTGETVFLEPAEMVGVNNRLKVAELDIRRESRRILEELTAEVAASAADLHQDASRLERLDVLTAGARFAVACDAAPIRIVDHAVIDLRDLRHPLLALRAGTKVVANEMTLGAPGEGMGSARVLVVSGPNAGGKTVLLKAVGLAALCARAGLPVTAAPGSTVGFFDCVAADIGDHQSVLGDLSTFSAHLSNLAAIVKEVAARSRSLVLLDELMAGTNPEQGAALARALLEELSAGASLVITTTHYDSLKALGDGDPRFVNGGMEYDIEHLRPTFKLRVGQPGRSYALDIAAVVGLPGTIIERARALVGGASMGLEKVLRDLEQREAVLEREESALRAARIDLEERASAEQDATAALQRREREMAVRTRELVESEVRGARETLREIIRTAREEAGRGAVDQAAQRARSQIEEAARAATASLPPSEGLDVEKLRTALASRALGLKSSGPAENKSGRKGRGGGATSTLDEAGAPLPAILRTRGNTLDVRGRRADEAVLEVERHLDQAALDGSDSVFIVHGHGTGALRKSIREYLALSPYVTRYRAGAPEEGGDGVSVAVLKG